MSSHTISAYRLANVRSYRVQLLGTAASFTTCSGTTVRGVITERPTSVAGALAITQPDGRWCAIESGDVVEIVDA